MPVDHLLLPEADALPAIVVTRLPSGLIHFVVVWRVHGRFVQVMDPARGRRWVRRETFLRDVYVHSDAGPRRGLPRVGRQRRLHPPARAPAARAGRRRTARRSSRARSKIRAGRPIAALDGAARTVAALVASGAVARGAEAGRLVALAGVGVGPAVARCRRSTPPPRRRPPPRTAPRRSPMRGAVLLRASAAAPLDAGQRAALPRRAARRRRRAAPRAAAELWRLLARDGRGRWAALAVGVVLAALGAVAEAVLFRALDRSRGGARRRRRIPARLAGHALGGAPLGPGALAGRSWCCWWRCSRSSSRWPGSLRRAGARLEEQLRALFLRKIPRLRDRYFQSRPVSDMAERAHLLHRLRALPTLGGEIARTAIEIVVVAAGLAWLDPRGAGLAIALGLVALLVPFVAEPAVAERDLRMRNHAGALGRFYLDALLGLVAVRTHGAEPALAREHRERLREWVAAARRALGAALTAEAAQTLLGLALAVRLLVGFFARGRRRRRASATPDPGTALLLVYWALSLPALGQELAALVQQIPAQRNLTLAARRAARRARGRRGRRGATDASGAGGRTPAQLRTTSRAGVRVQLDDVRVVAGGHQILEVDALAIAPGEQSRSSVRRAPASRAWWGCCSGGTGPRPAPSASTARRSTARARGPAPPDGLDRSRRLSLEPLARRQPGVRPGGDARGVRRGARRGGARARWCAGCPRGSATPLGEAGGLVSGGEGQRVRFGRGLLRARPRLVILDEPFRGLSRDQRQALLARARRRWSSATLLCVTHDIEETATFPRVLVVADGRVVEDGAPAALLAQPGSRYAALVEAERRVRAAAWSGERWRRLRLEDRRLVERPR